MVGVVGVEPTASCSQSRRRSPRLHPEDDWNPHRQSRHPPPCGLQPVNQVVKGWSRRADSNRRLTKGMNLPLWPTELLRDE